MKHSTLDAYKLFHEGSIALAEIEANGIHLDLDYLHSQIKDTEIRVARLEEEMRQDETFKIWKRRFGSKTKLTAPRQLADVLEKDLGYKTRHKTGIKGDFSASEKALRSFDLPIVKKYLEVSKVRNARRTFLDGLLREQWGGFVHPFFHLAGGSAKEEDKGGTRSYRSSSSDPNWQNQPKRNPVMAEIVRRCFIPRKGRRIGEIDFSGAEVKVAACYTKDPVLIRYIKDKTTDMHRDVAMQLYLLDSPELVHKDVRFAAKSDFTFSQFYGSYFVNCAQSLWEDIDAFDLCVRDASKPKEKGTPLKKHLRRKGIKELGACDPEKRAVPGTFEYKVMEVERDFWQNRFKVYSRWKLEWWEQYLRSGGFPLYTGFWINGILTKNEVTNYPIQGSSFHCLLWCLVRLHKWLKKNKMESLILGQIHDSIVMDLVEKELQDVLNKAVEIMTVDLPRHWSWIIVPLEVECEIAPPDKSWWETKKWKKNDRGLWIEPSVN